MMVDNPEGTERVYERVRAALDLGGQPAGGIFHAAGPSPNGGFRVIEIWESEEAARQFLRDRLGPALRAAGADGPPPTPEFWPVHNLMK